MKKIELIALEDIPLINQGDNLVEIILKALEKNKVSLNDGDILVIAQKIISKSEGRYAFLNEISPSQEAKDLANKTDKDPRLVQLILNESKEVIRYRKGVIVVENNLGLIHANAGIDRSNLESDNDNPRVLLLPVDPDKSATEIKIEVLKQTEIKIGVIINDSSGRAWRNGIVGIAIGSSGAEVLSDLRGESDLFGNTLEVTEVGIADEIASAASLLMGQGKEGLPVILVKGMKESSDMNNAKALIRKASEDLFR
ncbi:MAG: coenzyme F420-0:L-glutamate ligase [SAR86 cluster bacterium]|nr:coenzyme F420-0:L-glutamate ligase [SAR86 cluster bacterium]